MLTSAAVGYRRRMSRGTRRVAVIAAGLAAIAGVWWVAVGREPTGSAPAIVTTRASRAAPVSRPDAPPDRPPPAPVGEEGPAGEGGPPPDAEAMQGSWDGVDLEAVRTALPDNLYWKLSLPTDDPQVLEWRESERARWNVEYGKVLSGTGSEEEIRAYYDHRARLAGDNIEFATYLIDHHGEALPERDLGLLHLARRLNLARLEEIPRKMQEALERKQAQDAARAAWWADQQIFEGGADGQPNE